MRPVRRFLMAALAFTMAFSAIPASAASYTSSISFADGTNGFLSGWSGNSPRSGFISFTNDAGLTWHAIMTGSSSPSSLAVKNALNVAAISLSDNLTLNTTDAGRVWSRTVPVAGGGASFSDVATSTQGYVAVGKRIGTADGDVATIYTSPDGVTGWVERFRGPIDPGYTDALGDHVPGPLTYARMDAVAFAPDGQTGWAVGSSWKDPTYSTPAWKGPLVYKTVNGGSSWTTVTVTGGQTYPFNDLAVTDSTHAFAVGTGQYKMQTTDGTNWVRLDLPKTPGSLLKLDAYGIDAIDNTHMVVVGLDNLGRSAMQWTTDGWVAPTQPGGPTTPVVYAKLRSVSMLSATNWIAVGDEETIARTTNAGTTWTATTGTIPTVKLSSPVTNATLAATSAVVSGTATDTGVGVASVDVAVRRDGADYWDGTTWTPTIAWNSASVSATSSAWSWTWALDPNQHGEHAYSVSARATDGSGRASTIATNTGITVTTPPDTNAPDVALTAPSSNTTLTGDGTTITGTSTDNGGSGVAKVEVAVQRSSDSKYWNGGSSWTAAETWRAATAATPGYATWSLAWTFDLNQTGSISYTVKARATDVGNNTSGISQSTNVRIYNPDVTPPTASITYPSADTTLGGTFATVTGITTDTPTGTGVSKVEVSVRRDSDNTYWNGVGSWVPEQTWHQATLSADKSSWSWNWAFNPITQDGTIHYTITARATDGATPPLTASGSVTGVRIVQDSVSPNVEIVSPVSGRPVTVNPGEAASVVGTATDLQSGIRGVGVAVQRESDSKYWNGSAWVAGGPLWSAATLGAGGAFTWVWNLDAGQTGTTTYTVRALATDNAGNTHEATPSTGVSVINVPLVTMRADNNGGSVFSPSATAGRTVVRGATRAVDVFELTAKGGDVTVSSLTVLARSSATRLSTDVAEVRLYRDDGNGIFSASDTLLAGKRPVLKGKAAEKLTFTEWNSPLVLLGDETPVRIWVVFKVSRNAGLGDALGSQVSGLQFVGDAAMSPNPDPPGVTVRTSAFGGRTLIVRR